MNPVSKEREKEPDRRSPGVSLARGFPIPLSFSSKLGWGIGEEGLGKMQMMADLSEEADTGWVPGAEEEQQLPTVLLV